jgi:hypothetical protein
LLAVSAQGLSGATKKELAKGGGIAKAQLVGKLRQAASRLP